MRLVLVRFECTIDSIWTIAQPVGGFRTVYLNWQLYFSSFDCDIAFFLNEIPPFEMNFPDEHT